MTVHRYRQHSADVFLLCDLGRQSSVVNIHRRLKFWLARIRKAGLGFWLAFSFAFVLAVETKVPPEPPESLTSPWGASLPLG